ncbi:universal stress protein [Halomonas salipaludis]|uniref:Universal stress protein n=1 Tax=Halomonas salipaludis TaxID=2032625 RepID=A0A2A2EZF3_9GAMM|nr:universal stress protein [Halomonas salipaludis]PAU78068.1 universal stress protein [Halomonas salipaludis]
MFNSVLIAVDGSEHAKKALEVACQLVSKEDATLHILHIPEALTHETTLVWGIGAIALESSREVLEEAGKSVIERASEAARGMGASHVETHLSKGDPARNILRHAEKLGVDAIVMGSRGLGDFAGLMMGSVSHKVTHSAKCTVISVR